MHTCDNEAVWLESMRQYDHIVHQDTGGSNEAARLNVHDVGHVNVVRGGKRGSPVITC